VISIRSGFCDFQCTAEYQNSSWFYGVARDSDFRQKKFKGGITDDPYDRLNPYGTASMPDDEIRYRFLINVNTVDKPLLRKIEHLWLEEFPKIAQSVSTALQCLNRASSVEARMFESVYGIIEVFKKTVTTLGFSNIIRGVYISENEIEGVLEVYQKQNNFMGESQPPQLPDTDSLELSKDEFFKTFLPEGQVPRQIQNELWNTFEQIVAENDRYKGIVQWPTGTGKTVAMMLLLFLTYRKHCSTSNKPFRAVLISPRNDIFTTILSTICKFRKFGIQVLEGHEGRLSSLKIPSNCHTLILTTHAALTNEEKWTTLGEITHIHYDEVHRITGDKFKECLDARSDTICYTTGTSATPLTSDGAQNTHIAKIFGSPLNVIHRCDFARAIEEGYIAKPKFHVEVLQKGASKEALAAAFVDVFIETIIRKDKGGKYIAYLDTQEMTHLAIAAFKKKAPLSWRVYTAVENGDANTDIEFVDAPLTHNPAVMFACDRFREGSDIKGLEMTAKMIGDTIAGNIIVQIAGRALRKDYEDKEGWCLLVKIAEAGTTPDDIFGDIIGYISQFLKREAKGIHKPRSVAEQLADFVGNVRIGGKSYSQEETIVRIQAIQNRQVWEKGEPKERYELIRDLNKQHGLTSKQTYCDFANRHERYIEDPKAYFKDWWVSWYHYLGVDTSAFPQTKHEWIRVCKEMGLEKWDDYKKSVTSTLPANPGEMYEDYENWDKEFGVEDEVVW
jgi:hypothetical protein